MATPRPKRKKPQKNNLPENPAPSAHPLTGWIRLPDETIERIQRWLEHSKDESIQVKIKDGLLYLQGITLGELEHRVKMFERMGVTDPELQEHLDRPVIGSFRGGVPYREMTKDNWKKASALARALLKELGPRDAFEGTLTLQMTMTYNLSVRAMELADRNEQNLDAHKHYVNAATKMMRLYLRQEEALRKHRGQGQQQVVVRHVHVNAGGQAVVGHIEAGRKDAQEGRT